MDLSLINILTWIVLIFVVLLFALHLHISRRFGTLESLGIPCEKPWPFIGNTASELFSLVHENDVRLYKKYGRIYGHYVVKIPTIRISDTDMIRDILIKHFSNFSDHQHIEYPRDAIELRLLTEMRGEEWRQKKNVVTPIFTSSKLKQLTPLIEHCSIPLLKLLKEKSETGECFEVKEVFSKHLVDVNASCAFGIDLHAQGPEGDKFIKHANKSIIASSVIPFAILIGMPTFIRTFLIKLAKDRTEGINFFKELAYSIIKLRQTNNTRRSDFLQLLMDCLKDEEDKNTINERKESSEANETASKTNEHYKPPPKKIFTLEDVVANSIQFLFAGFETGPTTLSFIAYALATHQEYQDKLLDEVDSVFEKNQGKLTYDDVVQMQYMEMVIMETLRIYPPQNRIDRQCLATIKIKDQIIPKDVVVVIPVYAIHHDEEHYPEPHKYDPERFSPENKQKRNQYTFFGFGLGPRNCVGMKFALMELKLTLAYILKEYRFVCGPRTQVPLKFARSRANLIPEDGFRLCVEKRSTAA